MGLLPEGVGRVVEAGLLEVAVHQEVDLVRRERHLARVVRSKVDLRPGGQGLGGQISGSSSFLILLF